MKIAWRDELPSWAVLFAMFLGAIITWPAAPEGIPVHWNIQGEVDRYGGRFEGLLGIPLLALAVYALMLVVPRFDPGRANYAQFGAAYGTLRLALLAVLAVLYGVVLLWVWGYEVQVETVVPLAVGTLFMVVGNLLGKVRPNWFVGIRTPWTLSSKRSWSKTHRMGGRVFIAVGLGFVAAGLLRTGWAAGLAFGLLAAGVAWLMVYSYLVWREDPEKAPPAGTLPAGEG